MGRIGVFIMYTFSKGRVVNLSSCQVVAGGREGMEHLITYIREREPSGKTNCGHVLPTFKLIGQFAEELKHLYEYCIHT